MQTAFRDRFIKEEATCQAVVLLQKGGGNYRGIGLVEVVWKTATVILIFPFTTSITYHEFLHCFWSGRGTGTASLEVKILQKVMTMREELLHTIFLDLYKVYDALERSRFLEILEGYGVGTRYLCVL